MCCKCFHLKGDVSIVHDDDDDCSLFEHIKNRINIKIQQQMIKEKLSMFNKGVGRSPKWPDPTPAPQLMIYI